MATKDDKKKAETPAQTVGGRGKQRTDNKQKQQAAVPVK